MFAASLNEPWKRLCADFKRLEWGEEPSDRRSAEVDQMRRELVSAFRESTTDEKEKLRVMMTDVGTSFEDRLFGAAVAWNVAFARDGLPEDWFMTLIEAAIAEPNPSVDRWFVEPCLLAFGRNRTVAELESRRDTGTEVDDWKNARIKSALYWAGWPIDGFGDEDEQRPS